MTTKLAKFAKKCVKLTTFAKSDSRENSSLRENFDSRDAFNSREKAISREASNSREKAISREASNSREKSNSRKKSTSRVTSNSRGAKREYHHSAYWYFYNSGKTYSEATSYAGQYLDWHTYRPRMRVRAGGEVTARDWDAWRNQGKYLDSTFNPILFGVAIAMDIGVAMRTTIQRIKDPRERARMKEDFRRDLRILRRPFYYARETERRRELARERRKITRRLTSAPMPTGAQLRAAWDARKDSKAAMIRLGGMLHDLACYVDSRLKFDESGMVIGRNGGIRSWLKEHAPELVSKYKTLMRYKAMAIRLRQATDTKDPTPTEKLLTKPQNKIVRELLDNTRSSFASLEADLHYFLSPEAVLVEKKVFSRRLAEDKKMPPRKFVKRL